MKDSALTSNRTILRGNKDNMTIEPTNVHKTLAKYILADGFDLV